MYGISCTSRSFCLAAASFAQGNGTVALSPFVERWNGVRWSAATAGLPKFSALFGISCVTPDTALRSVNSILVFSPPPARRDC